MPGTKLPPDVVAYKRTPTFTEQTVPKGLLADHQTKAGTWGLINVESGSLIYAITEPGAERSEQVTQGQQAVVVPQQKHHVTCAEPVTFFVEFYR